MWTELLLLPYSFQKSQLITILSPGLRYLDLTKEEATDSFQVRLQSVFGSMLLVLHKSGNAIAVVASFIISIEKGVEEHKVGDIKGPEEDFQVEPSRKEGDRERTRVDRWREEAKKPIPIR